jgi:DNA-binding transcriptional LysR family regulator
VLSAVEAGLGVSVLPVSAVVAHAVRASSIFAADAPLVVSIYAREGDGATGELVAAVNEVLSDRQGGRMTSKPLEQR